MRTPSTGSGRALLALALTVTASAAAGTAAHAQIKLERQADGSVVITNRGSARPGEASPHPVRPARITGESSAVEAVRSWVSEHARINGLDEKLVLSVISAESAFDMAALSRKGAIGLMQLMPETAAELGITDPWDPESNIRGGTRYLRLMLDRFGQDLELALAAYNAGPGAVSRNGGIPPYRETRDYVRRVLSSYRGGPVRLADGGMASTRTNPLRVTRDANGNLVIATH